MVGLTYTWPVSAKFGNAHSKEKKNLGIYVVECNIKGEKIFFFIRPCGGTVIVIHFCIVDSIVDRSLSVL
jgi:hypothetical protein